jgi:hypothetical protein
MTCSTARAAHEQSHWSLLLFNGSELVKALNEMRVNQEPLDQSLQGRLSYLYSSTVSTAAELREVLTSVPLEDAWRTYLWLNPERPGDSVERYFVHANLTEISGDRAKALAEFKALVVALRAQHLCSPSLCAASLKIRQFSLHLEHTFLP